MVAWLLIFMRTATEGVLPPNMASLITFGAIAASLFGCVAGGLLSDRFGRTATTAGLMIVSGPCALLIGFAFSGPTWLITLIAIVWGIAIVGDSPALFRRRDGTSGP